MNKKFQEKIDLLIEQRQIEALKEQLSLKLQKIAQILGQPIIFQSNDSFIPYDESNYQFDGINQMDDWSSHVIGYLFDSLRSGINFQVRTEIVENNKPFLIEVSYNGYIVFCETDGELTSYAPFSPWFVVNKNGKGEGYVTMFYEMALQKEKRLMTQKHKDRKEESEKEMKTFWNKFKNLWGFR